MKMRALCSMNTGSEETWVTASNWLESCLSQHNACNVEARKESWYPTRLLDLGVENATVDDVRLIVTATEPPAGRYATLSHCWGSAQFIQLNRSTFNQLRGGIHVNEMPKTFSDAVQVTRRLGIRYLWIDSLCIFQDKDDLSDWLAEAALMHKVYSYSFCNISAAAAADSSEGLFFSRDPRLSSTSDVNVCVRGVEGFGLGVEYIDCNITNLAFWINNVSQCPLNRRGWVLQERLLAPRVLHFGRDQLFWECRETDAAESYPERLPSILNASSYLGFKNLNPAKYDAEMKSLMRADHDPRFSYYRLWGNVIKAYSQMKLTKSSDKLIALSGIAKKFSALLNDTYIAGMWQKYLASELLWYVEGAKQSDGTPSVRPRPYRAPSFSWTSIDARVTPGHSTDEGLLFDVVDVQMEYATDDITGLVKDGYLDLRGQLRPFKMVSRALEASQLRYMEVNGTVICCTKLDGWEMGPLILLDVAQNDFDAENIAQLLFYMPAWAPSEPDNYVRYLLFRVVDELHGIFQRIGFAFTDNGEEIEMLRPPYIGDRNIPCHSFSEGLHTIRVV